MCVMRTTLSDLTQPRGVPVATEPAALTDRVWLITGAGRGLGRAFTEAALASGGKVIATARSAAALDELSAHGDAVLPISLEVSDRDAVLAAVRRGLDHFGRIDVLINNAGYGLAGGVEEVSEEQARRQLEVNFFGALWCTQAVLPAMRAQGSGHIFQVSSVGGLVALPNTGLYCASKWALEGMSDSLAQEVAPLGIRVTILEPGPFRSDWNGTSMDRAEPIAAYDEILGARREALSGAHAFTQPGDPEAAGRAVLTVLASDNPPLRLLLGALAATNAPAAYADRLAEFSRWDTLSRSADFPAAGG
jgi:NAD(P)-dependent dehydrogenase (short-subunit alcohol dehydrogenase family)